MKMKAHPIRMAVLLGKIIAMSAYIREISNKLPNTAAQAPRNRRPS
jgi:hypothetical protein